MSTAASAGSVHMYVRVNFNYINELTVLYSASNKANLRDLIAAAG